VTGSPSSPLHRPRRPRHHRLSFTAKPDGPSRPLLPSLSGSGTMMFYCFIPKEKQCNPNLLVILWIPHIYVIIMYSIQYRSTRSPGSGLPYVALHAALTVNFVHRSPSHAAWT
jgi:hypothetical protein